MVISGSGGSGDALTGEPDAWARKRHSDLFGGAGNGVTFNRELPAGRGEVLCSMFASFARNVISRASRMVIAAGHAGLRRVGHFNAPWPDPSEAETAVASAERNAGRPVAGVEIDEAAMLQLWSKLALLIEKAPFAEQKVENLRYYYDNGFFTFFDGQMYFAMIGHFKPRRIIEIGSGFSSAVVLDARDYFELQTRLTFIEPEAQRLRGVLRDDDYRAIELIEQKVQDVGPELFSSLEADDILFIDSSHVLKTGSDVCFELFEILPMLQPGVIVHFHDVSCAFEYPRNWVLDDWRGWNETYAVRAFLMYNSTFKVLFFNDYFGSKFPAELRALGSVPAIFKSGGSLWLRRA
jgi:hypothetical protein